MKTLFRSLLVATLLITQMPASMAHHSVYGRFDVTKLQKVRGEFRDADMINPHSWFHFYEVDDKGARVLKDGKPVVWAFETPGPSMLRRLGITDKLYKSGDIYTIYYSPQLDGGPFGLFDISVFPDGKILLIGNKSDPRLQSVLKELGQIP